MLPVVSGSSRHNENGGADCTSLLAEIELSDNKKGKPGEEAESCVLNFRCDARADATSHIDRARSLINIKAMRNCRCLCRYRHGHERAPHGHINRFVSISVCVCVLTD